MRKITFLALAVAMILVSCGQKKMSDAEAEAAAADSIAATAAKKQVPNQFVTEDLKTFWLQGHVQTCVLSREDSDDEQTLAFDDKGLVTSFRNIKRDSKNRITAAGVSAPGSESLEGGEYEYNEAGYPSVIYYSYEGEYGEYTVSLKYDDHNRVTEEHSVVDGAKNILAYRYLEFDEKGNWTKREVTETLQEEGVDDVVTTYNEQRKITYYP